MDHDQLSKTILTAFFGEFIELFQKALVQAIHVDTTQFLDKETFTDLPLGEKKILDVVAKVETISGNPPVILIHIEIESGYPTAFPERMFNYYTVLRLRHHLLIISIVVYLEKSGEGLWRETHREAPLGKQSVLFESDAIGLPGLDAATYLATGNPLAFAFAAQMKRGDWSKGRLKYECLSRIVLCQVNEARRSLLINWVQTYLELSETEQQEFEALVTASPLTEEVRTVLLTYEGKMIQKGIQQGIQQAKQQTLLDLLQTKFGQLPAEIPQRVLSMEQIEELDQLLRQIITANSLDEMGLNHYANRGNEDRETQRSEN
jgi:hypothetical protein